MGDFRVEVRALALASACLAGLATGPSPASGQGAQSKKVAAHRPKSAEAAAVVADRVAVSGGVSPRPAVPRPIGTAPTSSRSSSGRGGRRLVGPEAISRRSPVRMGSASA